MSWYHALFSFHGRLNRQGFWLGVLFNFVFLLFAVFVLNPTALTLLSFLPLWISVFSLSTVIVKRLHDRNRSGWAFWMVLVPIVCYGVSAASQGIMQLLLGTVMPAFIIMMLLLDWGVFAGYPQPNRYGERGLSFKWKT